MSLLDDLLSHHGLKRGQLEAAHAFVVNLHHKQPFDQYIGRSRAGEPPNKWANPFRLEDCDGDRELCILLYMGHLQREKLWQEVGELADKRLGCFCEPKACHGHVLAELASVASEAGPVQAKMWLNLLIAQLVERRLYGHAPLNGAISGSRSLTDYKEVHGALSEAPWFWRTLHHGACEGTDLLGKRWGELMGILTIDHPAKWRDEEGNLDLSAGPVRNRAMIKHVDAFVALWDGKIKKSGTLDFLSLAWKSKSWLCWSLPCQTNELIKLRYYGLRADLLRLGESDGSCHVPERHLEDQGGQGELLG